MKPPPVWRFRIRSPSWMNMPLNIDENNIPSFGCKDFEGELKIPGHVGENIDFEFMVEWFERVTRYAEFEFELLLNKRNRQKKISN